MHTYSCVVGLSMTGICLLKSGVLNSKKTRNVHKYKLWKDSLPEKITRINIKEK